MPKAATVPKETIPQRQMETRAKNKTTHPGKVDKSPPPPRRRTKAEVQQEKEAKAQAKAALAEARQQKIERAAEFERADLANEDMVAVTPRPIFTPKPRPLSRNHRNSPLTPFVGTDTSDIEVSDDLDETLRPGSVGLVDSDLGVESDGPPPPAVKGKAKITATVDTKKLVDRKRRVVDVESDVPLDDEEQPREPKVKKVKVKMRDEINVAATKILENEQEGNKYASAKMVNPMGLSGKPASKVPSHSGGRQLKREGAIADIKKSVGGKKLNKEGAIADFFYPDKSTTTNVPDSSTRRDPDR